MYTREELPKYVKTAGKVTVLTAVAGFLVFMVAFVFDFGAQELNKVSAQGAATTTLTVLNTPPQFDLFTYEVVESSTSTPTNSEDVIQWAAIATDSNDAPYFLLVCSASVTPIAGAATSSGNLGTAPPSCGVGAVQWAVSTGTVSGELAIAATTTVDRTTASPFGEVNVWYSWVCDDDPVSPRCNSVPTQGIYSTSSSPFHVNSRPVLSGASQDGPVNPGDTVTFSSTATDLDTVDAADTLSLIVCSDNTSYDSNTNTCGTVEIASTTAPSAFTTNPTASRVIDIPTQDQNYTAYVYLIDEHGHEALAPIQADFEVSNVAPTLLNSEIILNGGSPITLATLGGETTGFTLDFTLRDNNSCLAANDIDPEIIGWGVSVFKTSVGTTSCDATAGPYNPNSCYNSGVGTGAWNLNCVATTTCASATSTDVDYACTFPLWFVADPTNGGPFDLDDWSAAVQGIDDDFATGTMVTTNSPVELNQLLGIDIIDAEIAYGSVEPGQRSGTPPGTLTATSVALNVGNTGLDQRVEGESMCGTFSIGNECESTGTSTIVESQQQFASTSVPYGSATALTLSSSSLQELELNVRKTTSTSTFETGTTYWGIEVPASITLAGSYQGLNSFIGEVTEDSEW